jgi:hypothetical protein
MVTNISVVNVIYFNAWRVTVLFLWFPMISMASSVSVVAMVTQTRRKIVGLRTFSNPFCIINLQNGNCYPGCIRCECADAYLGSEISQHRFMVRETDFGGYAAWRSVKVSTFRLIFRLMSSG